MVSQIQKFYEDKRVFITGGSGFLGRVIIEKLLRCTKVKCIYVLFRPKKGVSIRDRMSAWHKDPVFSELLKLNPNFADRVVAISGDCELPDLGISAEDRKLLVSEVQIVLHSAATVRFDEKLYVALDINTRGTRLVVQLAKEMPHLLALVHVSTGFSNCVMEHIGEDYYPKNLSCTYDQILDLRNGLSNELMDTMTPGFLKTYPNTYAFTKALAEQVLQKEASDIPASIFRPAMILGTYKEPIPGWTDNLYGPIAILYGGIIGVLRVTMLNKEARAHLVPVDYCANMIMTIGWKTAQETRAEKAKKPKEPMIYNYVAHNKNPCNWGRFLQAVEDKRYICPLEQIIWYPFVKTFTKRWAFELAIIIYHILPGHIIDMLLRVIGQKPKMMKIYNKIHANIRKVSYFPTSDWTFDMHNSDALMEHMSAEDRKLFECDMKTLSWDEYLTVALWGIRLYLAKEKPTEESLKKARRTMRRFYYYNFIVQTLFCGVFGAMSFYFIRFIYNFFYRN